MTEKDVFLHSLAANPYDKTTRLIFADWLEEHGEDEAAAWQRGWSLKRQQGEDYLRYFASRLCVDDEYDHYFITFEQLLACVKEGELRLPYDTPGWVYEETDNFWRAYADYTGTEEDTERGSFIRCSC